MIDDHNSELGDHNLAIRGLSQRLGGSTVLSDINIQLNTGERLAVLGPTGSGKTTLLRAIAGLDPIAAGEIHLGERSLNNVPPHRRQVGFVFQDHVLYPHLSVNDNLKLAITSKPRSELTIERISSLLGLTEFLGRRPDQISGGEQQRVAIARALLAAPRVVCFDEPFSNLDLGAKARLRHTLLDLHEQFPATWILVTHDPREAALIGDRTAILDKGRLLQLATTEQLRQSPGHRRVAELIDDPPLNLIQASFEGNREAIAGFRPEDVRIATSDSDDGWRFTVQTRHVIRSPGLWRLDGICHDGTSHYTPITALFHQSPGNREELVGKSVELVVDFNKLLWFDLQTGERLDEM